MDIIKCGTIITLKLLNVEGMITAATIRFDAVQYEFSYFINGEYKTIWINAQELSDCSTIKQGIGFNI